jgi:hypothetical protein
MQKRTSSYQDSFWSIPEGSIIYDPCVSKDENHAKLKALKTLLFNEHPVYNAILKATTSTAGGSGTAGSAMSPVFVDPILVDRTRKFTPVKNKFRRVTNTGRTADYNVITSKGGAFFAVEDANLTETNTTYVRRSTAIKYEYAVGRVTGQAMTAIPGYTLVGADMGGDGNRSANIINQFAQNILQTEVFVKMRELAEMEEAVLINGNESSSAYSANANGTEFDGIVQTMSSTNTYDAIGLTLTEDIINTAIQYAFDDSGRPDFAICDSATFRDVMGILADKRIIQTSMQVTEYGTVAINWLGMTGQIEIYPSQYLTNATGSKSMYFLDSAVWEIRTLQEPTYFEFGITNDAQKFAIKQYITLICRATTFNSSITNLD